MKKRRLSDALSGVLLLTLLLSLFIARGCGTGGSTASISRTLDANTSIPSSSTSTTGNCPKLSRDTSVCEKFRTPLGLTGEWLKFSCNVVLGLATSGLAVTNSYSKAAFVSVTTTALPDYSSNYFPVGGSYNFIANGFTVTGTFASMFAELTLTSPVSTVISQKEILMYIPINPTSNTHSTMDLGAVGVSLNGVPIYGGVAGGSNNFFAEAGSFDECAGHPDPNGVYHYHTEPPSISYQTSDLIGVMRDGYFIYGRYDYNSKDEIPLFIGTDLYKYGGHFGANPSDGSTSRFHYHATPFLACNHKRGTDHYSDDGNVLCVLGGDGVLTVGYLLTGHGNAGIFVEVPSSTVDGAPMLNNTSAIRYYYGDKAGTCTGC